MSFDELLEQLRQLSTRTYSYVTLAALFGPITLRLLGLKPLAQVIRPAALVVLLGGMYARQQAQPGATPGKTSSR